MRILLVNGFDRGGGAEAVALNLYRNFRKRGLHSDFIVGRKVAPNDDVLLVPNHEDRGLWYAFWRRIEKSLAELGRRGYAAKRLEEMAGGLADPGRILDERRGIEVFRFPGTYRMLDVPQQKPDILHLHNLHGGYFDLRALPWLSRQMPCVLTLHDSWLLSGHCAYTFDCDRWKSGCGRCPDLTIYPAVRRDRTAGNWQRKQSIYSQSRLHIATPSAWLMRMVEQSMLVPAIVDARVIPNGVDLAIFKPADARWAREQLQIPPNTCVLVFVASGIRQNRFKDYETLRGAVAMVAERMNHTEVLLLALGEAAEPEKIGAAHVRFIPFEPDPAVVAKYYQAADLCLHAAKADTFPNTILEALACGTPVVATAVGGIPEQVKSLRLPSTSPDFSTYADDQATGVLVAPGDARGMAESVLTLLGRIDVRRQLSNNAAKDARERFDLNRQCDDYLEWYGTILKSLHYP